MTKNALDRRKEALDRSIHETARKLYELEMAEPISSTFEHERTDPERAQLYRVFRRERLLDRLSFERWLVLDRRFRRRRGEP